MSLPKPALTTYVPGCTKKAVSHQAADFKKMRDSLINGTYDDDEGAGSGGAATVPAKADSADDAPRGRKRRIHGTGSASKNLKPTKFKASKGAASKEKVNGDEDAGVKAENA